MVWSMNRIRGWVYAREYVRDTRSGVVFVEDGLGWRGFKQAALDRGSVEGIADCADFELAVQSIRDPLVRDAVIAVMLGFEPRIVGGLVRRRHGLVRDPRSVGRLLGEGFDVLYRRLNALDDRDEACLEGVL